jgi:soluble lytic murein transglycosylase-like protein
MPRAAALAVAALLFAALAGGVEARAEGPSPASAPGPAPCRIAIAAVEPGSGLPPGLLLAIALVESGRADPARGGRLEPWPWAYNLEGEGRFPATRAAAVAEVAALRESGRRSIDVGCMQINLLHHPGAFRDLDQAFEPEANVRYAARFLRDLHARFGGNWAAAIANYHSGEMERGLLYHRRIALARIGVAVAAGGPIPLPAAAGQGLCAPGLAPMLTVRRTAARAARAARTQIVCRRPGGGGRPAAGRS